MAGIADILKERDRARQAQAAALATGALHALRQAGFPAWLVGSLARGTFRQHSDIDILIDAPPPRRTAALRVCLAALHDFPSSILFKGDLAGETLEHFMREAQDEPRLRS